MLDVIKVNQKVKILLSPLLLILFCAFTGPLFAAIIRFSRAVVVYSDAGIMDGVSRSFFSNYLKTDAIKPEDLAVKAKVALVMEKRQSVYEVLDLKTEPERVHPSITAARGPLVIPFAPPSFGVPGSVNLADYDELWVDYRELSADRPSAISVTLSMETKIREGKELTTATAVAEQRPLMPLGEINVSTAKMVPKDKGYTISRILRRPPDEIWRYLPLGEFTVIQRRFHRDLSGIEALDFVASPGSSIEGLNLRIAFGDNLGTGEMVELGKEYLEPCQCGDELLRINIPRILNERFQGKKKPYLQEIIVFTKDSISNVLTERPLQKIVFQGLVGKREAPASLPFKDSRIRKANFVKTLPSRLDSVIPGISRIAVNLGALNGEGATLLTKGFVTILPESPSTSKGAIIEKIRLVSFHKVNLPVFLRVGERNIARWGGPFINPLRPETGVEWPDILAYIPFKTLFSGLPLTKTRENVLTADGISLRSAKPLTVACDGRNLVVDGGGGQLELDLPVSSSFMGGTLFFLAAPDGSDQIKSIDLKVGFESGVNIALRGGANKPVLIPGKGRISHLSLKINTTEMNFHIRLKEAVLFRPIVLTRAEAFHKETSGGSIKEESVKLISIAEELNKYPGLFAGKLPLGFNAIPGIAENIIAEPVWIDAKGDAIPKIALAGGDISVVDNPWFKIESAVIVPVPSISNTAWRELIEKSNLPDPSPPPTTMQRKLLILLVVALCCFFFARIYAGYGLICRSILCRLDWVMAGFWGFSALALYVAGILKRPGVGENYFFTFGGVAAVFFGRNLIALFEPLLKKIAPSISGIISSGNAEPYFACAILALGGTAGLSILGAQYAAEQAAIVSYYCIAIGVGIGIVSVYRAGALCKINVDGLSGEESCGSGKK